MTTNINLPQGYKLIANYNDEIVLCQSKNPDAVEPYVTWIVNNNSVHTGSYFRELQQAQLSFAERAFGMSETIAEPIFRYGASKEEIKSAQQKFRLCEPLRNVYVDTDSSYKVNVKRNYGDLTPRTAREKMLVKQAKSIR